MRALLLLVIAAPALAGDIDPAKMKALEQRWLQVAIMAQELYGYPPQDRPRIIIQSYMRGFDAWIDCRYNYVEFNAELVRHDFDYVLDMLVPHEMAHAVHCHLSAYAFDTGDHGEVWAEISRSLGGPTESQRYKYKRRKQ